MSKKILVGIHRAIHDKIDPELEVYREILAHNKLDYIDLDSSDPDFWEKARTITHFIYKFSHNHTDKQIAESIIPVIQYQLGIPCFPDWETSWHYDDKIKQAYLLREAGFPPCEFHVFYHSDKALNWIKTAPYPLVYKSKSGSGASNVEMVRNEKQAKQKIRKMFGTGYLQEKIGLMNRIKVYNYDIRKIIRHYGIRLRNNILHKEAVPFWQVQKNYILFQKFLPGNSYDTRVQVTGRRAYAFIRFNRGNDFRASGSNNWSLDHSKINMDMVRIAFSVSEKLGFKSMAYDFIYDEYKRPVIVEISYCYGDYPEFSDGYWDPDLNWHDGEYVPQYLELVDLLNLPDLIQPEIKRTSHYLKANIN